MPASAKVPLRATGNTGRLAVRQAQCRVADELIASLNQPIIATSANISGRPTCRTGIEVFGVMDGGVDLVLDGGTCEGIGASTVDITELEWRMIKEGAITQKRDRRMPGRFRPGLAESPWVSKGFQAAEPSVTVTFMVRFPRKIVSTIAFARTLLIHGARSAS